MGRDLLLDTIGRCGAQQDRQRRMGIKYRMDAAPKKHQIDKSTGAIRLICVKCDRYLGISRMAVGQLFCAECIGRKIIQSKTRKENHNV